MANNAEMFPFDDVIMRRHFRMHFLEWKLYTSITISLMFAPKVRISNIPALVQIMARRRQGDKPLSVPVLVSLLTHNATLGLNNLKKTSKDTSKVIIEVIIRNVTPADCRVKNENLYWSSYHVIHNSATNPFTVQTKPFTVQTNQGRIIYYNSS